MKRYDYLITGAEFAGSVIAERLANMGKNILVIDKRPHISGNCYDYINKKGVLVHQYGPHYFRTNDDEVFSYLSNFTKWIPQKYRIKACVNKKLYPLPINRNTLNMFFGINLKNEEETEKFLEKKREKIENPKNSEEYVLSKAGREIYENFFKNYTIKQWGTHPSQLHPSVCGRIAIRTNDDDSYVNEKIQAMPEKGYTFLFSNMLKNKNIDISLNTELKDVKNKIEYDKLVYTGPIDEFFDFKFGKLAYRSIRFEHEDHEKEYYQNVSQVNYPNDNDFTRIVEIKHATKQKCPNTTIIKEYPSSEGEPYYPVPTEQNQQLYLRYKEQAEKLKDVFFIGRLATYKYLNMDEVVRQSLDLFNHIKNE